MRDRAARLDLVLTDGDYLSAGLGDIPGLQAEIWVHKEDVARGEEVLREMQEGLERAALRAPVLIKLGDKVSTDDISPSGASVLVFRSNVPVAVLENKRKGEIYAHERLRPIPLFLRGAGVSSRLSSVPTG